MTADKELKAFIDRILRMKEEQDAISADIRDIYAEAKMQGYDKTAMGKVVAHLRKIEKAGPSAADEQAMVFDTYLEAYERASGTSFASHTHETDHDPETGEVFDDVIIINERDKRGNRLTVTVDSRVAAILNTPSDAPHTSVSTVTPPPVTVKEEVSDGLLQNSPETANETPKQVYGDSVDFATAKPSQSVDIPVGGDKPLMIDGSDEQRPAASHSPEQAPEDTAPHGDADNASVEGVNPIGETSSPAANVGGDHEVAEQGHRAEAGEFVNHAPAHKPLRPHCLRPGQPDCGGYGDKTCHACLVAARTSGEAA